MTNSDDSVIDSVINEFKKINSYDYTNEHMSSYGQASWNDQLEDALNELNDRLDDAINSVQFKLDNSDYFLDD